MATKVKVNFTPVKVLEDMGLPDGARKFLANEVIRISDPFVPFSMGTLKNSATVENNGKQIKYSTPYARVMWYGEIMVDPLYGISAFPTDDGFFSRKGVAKIKASESSARAKKGLPTNFNFKGGPTRGSRWVERAVATNSEQLIRTMQNGLDRGLFK